MSSSVGAVSGPCRGRVGAVSGPCRGRVGAVSGPCRLTLVLGGVEQCRGSVGAVSEQCRPVSGTLDSGPPRLLSSSVGVSE